MTDVNKYINAYIDTCISQINDLTIKHIQVQAQCKVASDLVKEKEDIIENLISELESLRNHDNEKQKQIDNAKIWEDSYNAMTKKLSHMDTLMNQMGQMKIQITEKDEEIRKLQKQVIELSSKSSINRKQKKEKQVEEQMLNELPLNILPVEETVNDF